MESSHFVFFRKTDYSFSTGHACECKEFSEIEGEGRGKEEESVLSAFSAHKILEQD